MTNHTFTLIVIIGIIYGVDTQIEKKKNITFLFLTSIWKFEYIWIFSDANIHSYNFFDTNIFGYSFVSFYWYEYIRIFVRIVFYTNIFKRKNLTCAPKSSKVKRLKMFTYRLLHREILLPRCCVNYVLTFCCITYQKSNI